MIRNIDDSHVDRFPDTVFPGSFNFRECGTETVLKIQALK